VIAYTLDLLAKTDGSPLAGRSYKHPANTSIPLNSSLASAEPVDLGASSQGKAEGSRAEGLEEKRVLNAKLKRELLPEGLQFPSYKEGMQALVAGDIRPFKPGDLELLS